MKAFILDKYDTFFFDLYHTLASPGIIDVKEHECDILDIPHELWNRNSLNTYSDRALGVVKDPETIIRNILESAEIVRDEELIRQAAILRINKFSRCLLEIRPGIVQTIEKLYRNGKTLCLISNADVIDKAGWSASPVARYFDHVLFSCDLGLMKPDPEIYQKALKLCQSLHRETLFIGDGGSQEFKGAHALGIDTLMTTEIVSTFWPEKIDTIAQDADFVIDKLSKLLD